MMKCFFCYRNYLSISAWLLLLPAFADSPYVVKVQHYSLEQGLPNRGVTTIGQDRQGFIWIGTFNNAYRFDGYSFTPLLPGRSTKPGQLASVIRAIRPDPDGNLWFFQTRSVKHSQIIEVLSPGQTQPVVFAEKFHRSFPFDMTGVLDQVRYPNTITRPTDALLIPNLNGSVWRYEGDGLIQKLYKHATPAKLEHLFVTPTHTILLTMADSIALARSPDLPHPNNELIELQPNGTLHRRRHVPAHIYPIWVDSAGSTYLTYHRLPGSNTIRLPRLSAHQVDQLLYRLSPDGRLTTIPISFQRNPFPDPAHYDFTGDQIVYDAHHQLFWFLGKNVLFAWHPQHGIVFDLAASGFPIAKLSGFNHLFVDRTGAVWISTQNGFLLLTVEPNQFKNFLSVADEQTTDTPLSIRGIVKTGDWLWVNTRERESWLVNPKTGVSHQVRLPDPQKQYLLKQLYPAIQGHDGHIWSACHSLVEINPATLDVQTYALQDLNYCWSIWQDGRHNFWLGYDEGLSYFDLKQKKNIAFTRYNQYKELATNRVNGIFPDKSAGGLWIAASSGLYLLDTLRGIKARYSSQDAAPNQLPFDHITFVHPDPNQPGLYWLATRGGGLIRWERNTGHWQQFTQAQGLSNNFLYSIHEDKAGRLWMPSDYGLNRFQKKSSQVQAFLPRDGITHEEFNLTANYAAADGQLFLGGLNGITAFRPNELVSDKPTRAPLVVTQYFQVDGQTGERIDYFADFRQQQQVVMPPQNRLFFLSFALLDYRHSQQIRLSYRIVDWQDTWISQSQHELWINGLPPGRYQLQVRAQSPNGQWASDILTIPLLLLKPFYQQAWFILLSAVGVLGAIIGIFHWRNSRLIGDKKRLEAEVVRRTAQIERDKALIEQQAIDLRESATLKSRFFANVSHEFRTPLTLLMGPLGYLLKNTRNPASLRLLANMESNARQLLVLVSDLLDLSKLDAGQLKLIERPTDLAMLVRQTVAVFTSQADYTGISLTTASADQPLWVLIDGQKVETVLKNILANALRFTPAGGQIITKLYFDSELVRIAVSDTGTGIDPADLPHIFERYYQSQQANAQLRGGTGIGLALSRDYCTLWGGELSVSSQLGNGSTFTFTYPTHPVAAQEVILKAHADVRTRPELPLAEASSNNNLTQLKSNPADMLTSILMVEDNSDMVDYLTLILSPYYTLHITRNGQKAWEWLTAQPEKALPNVILSDIMMPEMDGLSLIQQIRQKPILRDIPIIMLTAQASLSIKLQALQVGVADYLTKPFEEDELRTRINNLLERSQERAAWQQHVADAPTSTIAKADEDWLLNLQQLILKNLTNNNFQVHAVADAVHISERQLYRRMKELTGFSPNQFIQEVRLQTAHEWLQNQQYTTVKEVCYAVGFQDIVYFSRLFMQRFGLQPSTLLRSAEKSATEHTDE